MKTPKPVELWSVIVKSKRSRWIDYGSLSTTKKGAKSTLVSGDSTDKWREEVKRRMKTKEFTIERVVVSMKEGE